MELIRLEEITKTYQLGEIDVRVLKGVSLSIARGEMVALMGASGSGKTTLMNILGCLDRPSSGRYWLDGQEMSRLGPNDRALVRTAKLGFVFQSFNLLPRTTAAQNVVMPLDYSPKRPHRAEARRLAHLLLDRVGLDNRSDHEPSQLSGGQQQRVAIARSLIGRPSLLLADEPTGNLDSHTSVEILRMFQRLNEEGITVILVTHDPKVAAFAHRTIRIVDGLIAGDESHSRAAHDAHGVAEFLSDGPTIPPPHIHNGNGAGSAATVLPLSLGDVRGEGELTLIRHPHPSPLPKGEGMIEPLPRTVGTAIAEHSRPRTQTRPTAAAHSTSSWYGDVEPRAHRSLAPTLLPNTLRTALGALRANKMRSALTALGVIIGVAAVIAMTEIGEGSRIAIQKTIASMGANNLIVLPGAIMSGSVNFGSGSSQTLKPADMEEILHQCPAVVDVAPMVWTHGQVVYGNHNWVPKNMSGTSPSYLSVRDWNEMEEGDMFTDRDVHDASKVCVIGTTLARELFLDESPVGKELRIQNVPFRVVGVLSSKGANMMGSDQDDVLLAPWTTVKFRLNGNGAGSTAAQATAQQNSLTAINSLNSLYPGGVTLYDVPSPIQTDDAPQSARQINLDMMIAKAVGPEEIQEAIDQISGLLRERHHLPFDRGNDFDIRDMTEVSKTMSRSSELMGVLLLVVAAISLVVGGVGIMNIMLVSVTERTREIGLRMAVGARSHHILRQFLVEAVLLCLLGGAIGILFGRGASILVRSIEHWPTAASIPVIVVAALVSAGVGILFGFYPAWKASRLDPIEALRYE
ncbi:MAG TPA: ABC transporter permease [Pirellulales bacterium]|jgi:ABC-type lipoprotein export system ATPase subunit/ABC-type antimicrobial peptide transport system permease subunit|nr:ABC transporter permease [Pirellulales bacterium]